jgi:hypothetical protein
VRWAVATVKTIREVHASVNATWDVIPCSAQMVGSYIGPYAVYFVELYFTKQFPIIERASRVK